MEYLKSIFNVKDKTVVITGGSGILGTEMARGLLSAEAKVVILGTNDEKLKRKTDELKQTGSNVAGFKCNVLDEKNILDVKDKVLEKFGSIDVLINAAGGNMPGATIGVDKNIFDLNMDDFKRVTDLNLNGTVLPSLIFGKVNWQFHPRIN